MSRVPGLADEPPPGSMADVTDSYGIAYPIRLVSIQICRVSI